MIRINLANSLIKKSEVTAFSGLSSSNQTQFIIKILLIVGPLVGISMYEQHDLEIKRQILETTRAEDQKLAQELLEMSAIKQTLSQIKDQKKELEEKFTVMRKIFGLRHLKLQTIRALQDEISKDSWLFKVMFGESTTEVEGFAPSLEEAQAYIARLSKHKTLFKNVISKSINKEAFSDKEYYHFEMELDLKE